MIDPVLGIIERCNQRGGRPLSVVDLLLAETFTLRQIAWLLARIEQGASWMVGARPGGAGKTTIMSALLAMLPAGEAVRFTSSREGWDDSLPGECVVSSEISPASYEGYVWGEDVRRLARLAASGCRVVTNLHADTLEEARLQIVDDCGADPADFGALGLFLPIEISREGRRRVRTVFHSVKGGWREMDEGAAPSEREGAIAAFVEDCAAAGRRTVGDVRGAWLRWQGGAEETGETLVPH